MVSLGTLGRFISVFGQRADLLVQSRVFFGGDGRQADGDFVRDAGQNLVQLRKLWIVPQETQVNDLVRVTQRKDAVIQAPRNEQRMEPAQFLEFGEVDASQRGVMETVLLQRLVEPNPRLELAGVPAKKVADIKLILASPHRLELVHGHEARGEQVLDPVLITGASGEHALFPVADWCPLFPR